MCTLSTSVIMVCWDDWPAGGIAKPLSSLVSGCASVTATSCTAFVEAALAVEPGEETDLNFEKAEGDLGVEVDETYVTYRKLASNLLSA